MIRRYRPGDGRALAEVLFRSVREAGRTDYSAEQVEAWVPQAPDAGWFDARADDGRLVLVAQGVDGGVLAYCDMEPDGHIDHVYCLPEFVGQGVASRLYDELELHAASLGIQRLYVEASEAARRMFLRKGFMDAGRRDFVRNGVEIHNFEMEKQLA